MPEANKYISATEGDDDNDGTEGFPVRTMERAEAVCNAGDRLYFDPGVYPTSLLGISRFYTKAISIECSKRGQVIFDFEGLTHAAGGHINTQAAVVFVGIKFRNPAASKFLAAYFSGTPGVFANCAFYQRDGAANQGSGAHKQTVKRCSFYNLTYGFYGQDFSTPVGSVVDSYFKDCTTPVQSGSTADYNAYPGNVEANGLDTDDANTDPGFVAPESDDMRLDPTDAVALEKFRTLGRFGGQIGFAPGPYWDHEHAQTRWLAPIPAHDPDYGWGAWWNDPDYEDPGGPSTTGTIVEDPSTFEPILDGISGGALSAAMLSPVLDRGPVAGTWNAVVLAVYEDLLGGAALKTLEYRVAEDPADLDVPSDAGPSDSPWVTFVRGDELNLTERALQLRITLQADYAP